MSVSLNNTTPSPFLIDFTKINKFIIDGGLNIKGKEHLTLRNFILSELIDLINENKDNAGNQFLVEGLKIISLLSNKEIADFKPFLPQLIQAFALIKKEIPNKSAENKSLALSQLCLFGNKQFDLKLSEFLGEKDSLQPEAMLSIEIKSFMFFRDIFYRLKKLNEEHALRKNPVYVNLVGAVYKNFKQPKDNHKVVTLTPHENEFVKEVLKFEKAFELYSDAFWNLTITIAEEFKFLDSTAPGKDFKMRLQKLSNEISHAKLYYQLLKQSVNQKIKYTTENHALDLKKIEKQNNSVLEEIKERKEAKILSIIAKYPKEHQAEARSLISEYFDKYDVFMSVTLKMNNGRDFVPDQARKMFSLFVANSVNAIAESANNNLEQLKKELVSAHQEFHGVEKSLAVITNTKPPVQHRVQNPERNKLESDFFEVGSIFLESISEKVGLLINQYSSAGQTDADFYRSLEEWDNIETEEKASPISASAKQNHPSKVKQQSKPKVQAIVRPEQKRPEVKSEGAAFLEKVENLSTQDLIHQSMALLSEKVQLGDGSPEAKEVESHFFMAGAALELMSSLLAAKDIVSLGALVPMHLLDCHIMIEQMVTLELMKHGYGKIHSHSLVQLLMESEIWDQLEISSAVFMRNIDQGLIWARYLGSSIKKTRGELPQGLEHLSTCFDLLNQQQISKANLKGLISFVMHVHYNSLKFLSERFGWNEETKNLVELYTERGLIEQKMFNIINEFNESELMQVAAKPMPEQQQILSIYEKISRIQKQMTTGSTQENQLKSILKDIQFHLLRMSQSIHLNNKVQKSYFSSLFARNLMNMQWVFEQLYGARFLLKNHFTTNIHEFGTFQLLLGDSYQQKSVKRLSHPETISKFNFGLSGHYPYKKPGIVGFDLAEAIESDRKKYLVPEHFKPVGKKGKHAGTSNTSEKLLTMLSDSFAVGLNQASNLLQDLIREGGLDVASKDLIRV